MHPAEIIPPEYPEIGSRFERMPDQCMRGTGIAIKSDAATTVYPGFLETDLFAGIPQIFDMIDGDIRHDSHIGIDQVFAPFNRHRTTTSAGIGFTKFHLRQTV